MQANAASATITRTGNVALRPGVTELRLTGLRALPLIVTGEPRDDISYELWVESNGPDEAGAKATAEKTRIVDDDLGMAQALSVAFPTEGTQSGRLTLHVPSRILVRLESSGRVTVSGVARRGPAQPDWRSHDLRTCPAR